VKKSDAVATQTAALATEAAALFLSVERMSPELTRAALAAARAAVLEGPRRLAADRAFRAAVQVLKGAKVE
jgi:hypothetical protein